jgi:hypothetical protein
MTHSVKVSGSRNLRKSSKKGSKGSKKGSKSSSKKHNAYDFSNLLKNMDDEMMPTQPMMPQGAGMTQGVNMMSMMPQNGMEGMPQMQMPQMGMQQGNMMPTMPQMGMDQMGMAQMNMPQMGMDQMGMAQMNMPQMGMPQMMMGVDPKSVDPLHLHSFVPQNENVNINNYGVSANQLISGSQMENKFAGRQPQSGGRQAQSGGSNVSVKLGEYVVKPGNVSGWVYDVVFQNATGKEVAFVSFTQQGAHGYMPLTWLNYRREDKEEYKQYNEGEIKQLAKQYAINQGVNVK